jgi:hypothetical protein
MPVYSVLEQLMLQMALAAPTAQHRPVTSRRLAS